MENYRRKHQGLPDLYKPLVCTHPYTQIHVSEGCREQEEEEEWSKRERKK